MDKTRYFQVAELNKSFGGLTAVRNLSFEIESGKITSLIGPNGAGKTTTFNLISGFLQPDGGRIFFKDREITGLSPNQVIKLGIARTFQDLRLFNKLSVFENVLLGFQDRKGEKLIHAIFGGSGSGEEDKKDRESTFRLLRLVGIDSKAKEQAENLSYGEQKLLTIARLLATDAELLMLDEPFSGIPLGTADRVMIFIRDLVRQGKTIFIIEHNMEAVMGISDRVIVLNFGELIASGTPEQIQENQEVIRVYLGI